MSFADILATMRAAGRPLSELVGLPQRGIGRLATARLLVDKATRDQIVLFEPALAPFLRRIARGVDIHPWYCEPSRYLVMLPSGWSEGADVGANQAWEYLAQRCPPLHRHLAPVVARKMRDGAWWEFPDCDLTPFAQARMVWPAASVTPRYALTTPGHLVGPGACHIPASLFLLGVLMSRLGWLAVTATGRIGRVYRLAPEQIGRIPIPEATDNERSAIEALAQRIVDLTREQVMLERRFTQRLLRDFGPPGTTPGAHLERWWELDFAALRRAIAARFGGDIPSRFREEWQAQHADAVVHHAALADTRALAEATLHTRVAMLYGVGP
ncbi:MAG: hypothetical protein ACUVWS_11150 [Roseiflexus sp.]